jgi:hypothetical protein
VLQWLGLRLVESPIHQDLRFALCQGTPGVMQYYARRVKVTINAEGKVRLWFPSRMRPAQESRSHRCPMPYVTIGGRDALCRLNQLLPYNTHHSPALSRAIP